VTLYRQTTFFMEPDQIEALSVTSDADRTTYNI
jgi:hypothetical protein